MFIQETMRCSGSYGSFGENRFPILFKMGSQKNCIRQFEKASAKGATWLPVDTKLEQFRKKPNQEKFIVFSQKNIFFIFGEMELCCPKINGILIFAQKNLFLFFWEMELFKKPFFSGGNFTKLGKSKNPTLIKLLIF